MADRTRLAELNAEVTAFFRALEALRARNAEKLGLAATEYRALARVVEGGELTPKTLSISMHMSTGAITSVTDSLVARGLLERVANPVDRRSVMLIPTDIGRSTIESSFSAYHAVIAGAVGESSDDAVRDLTDLLSRITETIAVAQP